MESTSCPNRSHYLPTWVGVEKIKLSRYKLCDLEVAQGGGGASRRSELGLVRWRNIEGAVRSALGRLISGISVLIGLMLKVEKI